ncbi:MAG TPA: hypothetical protein VN903_01155, partial [Polyangia bacterium]|nr:hypothetical protein [Polyangia bacterium]
MRAAAAERLAIDKYTFDAETAGMTRVAAAQKVAAAEMIADLKRVQVEEEKAAKARLVFAQQMAPSASLSERNAVNKFTFDQETAGWARVAAAQRTATDQMIANLRRLQQEEVKANAERFQFAQQIAPQTQIRFQRNAAGELEAVDAAIKKIGNSSGTANQELRHVVAGFDEIARGQRGAFFSTLGAAMRDAGFSAGVLGASVAGLSAIMVTAGIERLVDHFGDLALKERTAAAAAGITIDQYSRLRATMMLVSGDANRLDQVFGMLSEHIEQAKVDPFSRSASAFATLRVTMADLDAGLRNPATLLETLRQRWQSMGDSMVRTELFRTLLGRGFESMVPLLNLTSSELAKLNEKVAESGNFLDEKMSAQLVAAAEKTHALSGAFEGLEQRIALLVGSSGLTDWLTTEVQQLGHATDGWIALAEAIGRVKPPSWTMGNALVGLAGIAIPGIGLTRGLEAPGRASAPIPPVPESAPFGRRGKADIQDSAEFERYDLAADKRELDRKVKLIHDETSVQDAAFAERIAKAGHDRDLAAKIAEERAQFNIDQARKEAETRQYYVDRANRFNQPAAVTDVLGDTANAQVRAIQGRTEAERAASAAQDQAYQTFKQQKLDEIAQIKNAEEAAKLAGASPRQQEANAREAATRINQIWVNLRDQSTATFKQGVEEYARLEKERVNAATSAAAAIVAAQSRVFSGDMERESSLERLDAVRINSFKAGQQIAVSTHQISKAQMEAAEANFTSQVMAGEEQRVAVMLNAAGLTEAQQQKLYEHLSELYAKDAEQQAQYQAKITADIEAENEKRKKAFTALFDGIGSSLEHSLTGLLTGQTTWAKAIQNVRNSLISGIVSTVSSVASEYAGKQLGPMLGLSAEQSKGGLGSVLGSALFKALGMEKDVPQDAMKGVADKWQKAVDAQLKATDLQGKAAQDLSKAAEAQLNAAGKTGGGTSTGGGRTSDRVDTEALPAPRKAGADYGGSGAFGAETGGRAGGSTAAMDPMAPAGTAAQSAGMTTITSPSGRKFRVASEFAPNFQGFINEYENQGGVIGPASGGLSERPGNASYHPLGRAIDVNQIGRNIRSGGTTLPVDEENAMAARWGLYPGSRFSNPDAGHFEVRNAAAAHAALGQADPAATQLKTSVDKLDSTTKSQTTTLTRANDNSQQLASKITANDASLDQDKRTTDELKATTSDDKNATTANTQAIQALTQKMGSAGTGGLASPPAGLGGGNGFGGGGAALGVPDQPGLNVSPGTGIASATSSLSGAFGTLTSVVGIAASATSLFGGQMSQTMKMISGGIGLLSQVAGLLGGGGGSGGLLSGL